MKSILNRILPAQLQPYGGRIMLTLLGFVIALLFLTIGFWPTLLLVLFTAVGYVVGKWEDGVLNVDRLPIPNRWK